MSAVSVPKKLLALHVQFPVSSGSAFSKTKWLPMTALPLVFFAQIISGLGVPWAEHWNCIESPFVAVYDFGGRIVMLGLAKQWKKEKYIVLSFYFSISGTVGNNQTTLWNNLTRIKWETFSTIKGEIPSSTHIIFPVGLYDNCRILARS